MPIIETRSPLPGETFTEWADRLEDVRELPQEQLLKKRRTT